MILRFYLNFCIKHRIFQEFCYHYDILYRVQQFYSRSNISNLHIKTIQHSCKALTRKAAHTKRNNFVNTVLIQ